MRRLLLTNVLLALSLVTACGVVGQSSAPPTTGAAPAANAGQQGGAAQAGGAAARPAGAGGGAAAAPVSVARVEQGPIRTGPTFTGDVVALAQVNLVPRAAGAV